MSIISSIPVLLGDRGAELRPAPGSGGVRGETYHVAYHLKHPARVVACKSLGAVFTWLPMPLILVTVTVLIGWGTLALALPAFR
ncbi:hypothetical protein [Streptomyces purpureus]|uniref:hypothetical protein n=1 Tax=Streptomyces purpureus TaxID=1951 RepID=UPI00037D2AA2|nr:hypothetical protein [Streptomyces purpureus]